MFRVRFAVVNGEGPVGSGLGHVSDAIGSLSGTGDETGCA
jgi:hypothetical protein